MRFLFSTVVKMIHLEDYVRRTLQARVYDVAKETPLDEARLLSRRLKNKILLKRGVDFSTKT